MAGYIGSKAVLLSTTAAEVSGDADIGGSVLVDTIKADNGTTALTIDSSGRVLTPARPAFRARIAGSTGNHGDNGTLVFETEDFDVGGVYNTSNGKFTAPIDGVYHLMFRGLSATSSTGGLNTAGEFPYGDFFKNGTALAGTRFYGYDNTGSFYLTLMANTTLQLSSGDEITVVMGSEFIYSNSSAAYDPCFEGYLIG